MKLGQKLIERLFFICILFFLVACGKDDGLNESSNDSIQIASVDPSENLVNGQEYNFIVKVKYELNSFEKAVVSISFNDAHINSFKAIPYAHGGVEKGSGQHTFDVTVIAKDWKDEGDFIVHVSLYESVSVVDGEEPRDPQQLSNDTKILSFLD